MVLVLLRFLLLFLLVAVVAYFVKKSCKKVELTEHRREEIEEAITNIKETERESKIIPKVSESKLKNKRAKVKKIIVEGEKNAR